MKKLIIALSIILCLSAISFAAIPTQINFQGILKDSTGHLVTNPALSVVFSIYADQTTTTALWSETQTITVEGGIYSVQLGSVNPISADATVFDGTTRYLGLKVDPDTTEMSPRLPLISVPYAYYAKSADSAAQLGGVNAANYVRLGSSLPQETTYQKAIYVKSTDSGGRGIAAIGYTGGDFTSDRAGGTAVWGFASSEIGSNYGGRFIVKGNNSSVAVNGESLCTGSTDYGGRFTANTNGGYGVYASGKGYGGFFWSASGGSPGYGIYANAVGANGKGIYAEATDPTSANIGGHFYSSSINGTGVFAKAGAYGISTEAYNSNGIGLYAKSASYIAVYVDAILKLKPLPGDPSVTAEEGMLYYNSVFHKLMIHNGTKWCSVEAF